VSEIAVMFSPPLPEDGVRDLATTLRELREFDLGLARPDDPLDLLLVRPSATNPIQWLSHEGTQMNISDELHERFHDRLKRRDVNWKGPLAEPCRLTLSQGFENRIDDVVLLVQVGERKSLEVLLEGGFKI